MNQTNKEKIDFFNEYSKNFPDFRDVQSKKISDQERFIKQQAPFIDGASIVADYGGYFMETNFNCSDFSAVKLDIHLIDAECLVYHKTMHSCVEFSLKQEFFNRLFSDEKSIPTINLIKPSDFYGEDGKQKESVRVICSIYPVLPLENRLLYKVDVSVEIPGTFPIKTDHYKTSSSEAIVNFVQRHFTVDKEGLTFQEEAEGALADCFRLIKEIFIDTKDKKIYVVQESYLVSLDKIPMEDFEDDISK